jgi:hypothetical protein
MTISTQPSNAQATPQPAVTLSTTIGKIVVGSGVILLAKLFPTLASSLTPTEIGGAAVTIGLAINEAIDHLAAKYFNA